MKRIGCLCLAAAVLLSVTACGGSASSVSSSVPEVSSSSAETAEVSAVDFYDAFDEIIQDGEYGMHAKGITDNAKKFIADHDELFSQNNRYPATTLACCKKTWTFAVCKKSGKS